MSENYLCPVCGYPGLYEQPWVDDSPSDEICPSCGTHFGYDDVAADAAGRQVKDAQLRDAWRLNGCPWFSSSRQKPPGWNADGQLAAVDDG